VSADPSSPGPDPDRGELEIDWLGHATVDVRLGPTRIVTDPVLRDRVAHLRRRAGTGLLAPGAVDVVVISHLHHDHLDLPSLRRLPTGGVIVVPRGAGRLAARASGRDVVEVVPEDEVVVGPLRVTAVPAAHAPGRTLRRLQGEPLGFLLQDGARTVYFPGDTDLHPVMADLPAPDVALLPIWGWGPVLGSGHLDPGRAAEAAARLRARAVLPVHWGTFTPIGARGPVPWLERPAADFAAAMSAVAPDADLRIVRPGAGPQRFAAAT
jgi:L-ascorbate metabolism protein UlaG (beta-lactamase superfamily)